MKAKVFFSLSLVILVFVTTGNFRAQNAIEMYTIRVHVTGNGSGQVISSPPGINCSSESTGCTGTFERGTPVTLRPRSLHGNSEFGGWNVTIGSAQSCAASGSDCNFIILEDSSVRARFVAP